MEEKRPGEYFPIGEEEGFTSILSSHDLCCIGMLDELERAGVTSFKIEGRMKTAYYVASVVRAYRACMDGTDSVEACRAELELVRHRPYSDGFYHGFLKDHHANTGRYSQGAVFVASVLGRENGALKVRQRNRFGVGQTLELMSPGREIRRFPVESLRTASGESREDAPHPNEILYIPCPFEAAEGDLLRRRENDG